VSHAALAACAWWLLILAGCSSRQPGSDAPPQASAASMAVTSTTPAVMQSLRRAVDQMPRSFDPTLITDIPAQRIVDDIFEGLTTLAVDGSIAPGVAESWEVSGDGKLWTFHLRAAQWSNGEAVTADDFVYSWRRLVNPVTAADYAQSLSAVRNALAIATGKLPITALGITALDAHTLRIELEEPTPYLLTLLTDNFTMPLHRATLERWGDDWVKPEHIVSNGPFVLTEVIIGNRVRLKKNPRYWAADTVRISDVSYYPLDRPAQNSRYLAGEIDYTESFTADQFKWLRQQLGAQAVTAPFLGTVMLGLNMQLPPFANNHALRMALTLAVDREIFATRVRHGMYTPAWSLVPPLANYIPALPEWAKLPREQRLTLARRYYSDAGYGADHPLRVTLTYPTDADNRQIYESLAAMWRMNLGAEVESYNEEFRVMQQNRRLHQLQLFHFAWIGDYPDPYTFMQLFQSGFGINDGLYANARYDATLKAANAAADIAQRFALFRDAESILNAEVPYIPLYYYSSRHLIKPWLKGWQSNILDRNPSRYMVLMQHQDP
jgi:oligopeptide transport system substrate-binding protein